MNNNKAAHFADEYDQKINITIPHYGDFHKETLSLVKVIKSNPGKWLDTGCGTGTMVLNAVRVFTETGFILADPSKLMLDIAAEKLKGCSNRGIKFLEPVSTQDLDFHDYSFDVITAIQSHHYLDLETRRKATCNCFRMLKNRGVYITFENTRPLTEMGIKVGLERWRNFQTGEGKPADEADRHMDRFGKEYFPITVFEHVELLKDAGFSTVELFWMSYMQAGFYAVKE